MSELTDGRFVIDGVVPGQCPGPVPTLTCVAGNRGVRSSGGQAQAAPESIRGLQVKGKAGRANDE